MKRGNVADAPLWCCFRRRAARTGDARHNGAPTPHFGVVEARQRVAQLVLVLVVGWRRQRNVKAWHRCRLLAVDVVAVVFVVAFVVVVVQRRKLNFSLLFPFVRFAIVFDSQLIRKLLRRFRLRQKTASEKIQPEISNGVGSRAALVRSYDFVAGSRQRR